MQDEMKTLYEWNYSTPLRERAQALEKLDQEKPVEVLMKAGKVKFIQDLDKPTIDHDTAASLELVAVQMKPEKAKRLLLRSTLAGIRQHKLNVFCKGE